MAITGKIYPKAIACHSPEELAIQNSRLNQQNDELTSLTRRLSQTNEDLTERTARLRRWTVRLTGACVMLLLLAGVMTALAIYFPAAFVPKARRIPETVAVHQTNIVPSPTANEPHTPKPPPDIRARAPLDLPPQAIAKANATSLAAQLGASSNADFLEALGGLSATHLFQSHLNIGLLADGAESETYTIEEADQHLRTVVEKMKLVDTQLAKVAKSGLEEEDRESIAEMQAVTVLLQLQAASLRGYWATGDMRQADEYHQAREAAAKGLAKIMGNE